MYVYIQIDTYMYAYMHTCIHMHIYAYTYIHFYTYINIFTCKLMCVFVQVRVSYNNKHICVYALLLEYELIVRLLMQGRNLLGFRLFGSGVGLNDLGAVRAFE